MSKKHFIALANHIRSQNWDNLFTRPIVESIADFCQSQNSAFNRERWLSYIAGECGPNGGAIRK